MDMIKIAIYGIGKIEEKYLDICEDKYPEIRFVRVRRKADAENAKEAAGCHAVVISTACPPTRELLEIWKDCGVEYVATRSIGIDHMDGAHDRELWHAGGPYDLFSLQRGGFLPSC